MLKFIKKKEVLKYIQDNFFNATDLMESLIENNSKVILLPFFRYFLHVSKYEDFEKAYINIRNKKF